MLDWHSCQMCYPLERKLLLLLLLYIFMLNVLLICLKTRAKLMILTGFDTV